MANLKVVNAQKYYGNFHALKDISISIQDGEFVVLVGPSGCGKSTLLRMIAGLEEISAGDVIIGEKVVSELAPKERDIAMVFQNYALYPHMTVAQNMGFALKLQKMPKEEISSRITRAADILGLKPLLGRYPRQLSGGQRQRVAMGRAIVRNPSVFLFDEPLSNLDAKLRVQMRAEIKQLHQRLKTTTVYVTHDQVEAMTMADRIVVLRDGVVEQVGTPLELYDNPANEFVAGFMGSPSMNFIKGELSANGFVTPDGITLPCSIGDRSAVTYGIRPEHLKIDDSGVPFMVKVIEPMGSETQVIGSIGNQPVSALFRERIELSPGQTLPVMPVVSNIHLFDNAGRRAS